MRVAAYQMTVTADLEANLALIADGIERAAAAGAHLIALPECALPGYPPLHYADPHDVDTERIALLNGKVCELAANHSIAVVLGTITLSDQGLLNSAMLISPDGEVVGRYDKLHLMPDDHNYFVPGFGLGPFEINGLTMGMLVCYDARFPEPFRYLRECGAELIVNISNACGGEAWKRPVLEGTYRTRASENSCFLIAVNAAGPEQMAVSRIVNTVGLDLAAAQPDTDEMLIADIDLSETDTGYFYDRRTDQLAVVARWIR